MVFRFDPNDTDPVVRSVDRRIHREALRQLDSIDLDDPDDRVDPLPPIDGTSIDQVVDQVVDDRILDDRILRQPVAEPADGRPDHPTGPGR